MVASGAAEVFSSHTANKDASEMLGMLLLSAAYACYGMGVPGDAMVYVDEAKRLAERTGDTMTLSLFFGPTNIRIWEISMEVDGGDPGKALALARKPSHCAYRTWGDGWRTIWIPAGRWPTWARDDEALRNLIEADRLAPAHVRADPLVWETVRDIVDRRRRKAVAPEVRTFCGRLGVAL